VPLAVVPVLSGRAAVTPALALSIALLVLEWTLPADASDESGLREAEAFLFLDGFISAIFPARQISIQIAKCYAQRNKTR